MAKDKLTDYDSTASGNLDVGGISVAEGMLPSGVNNAIRELMSHQADAFGAGTPLYVDQTNNRLGVGTSSPNVALQISSPSATLAIDDTTTSIPMLRFRDNGTTIGRVYFTGGDMRFDTNGTTEAMRLDSSGNLLVGKTSTSTGPEGVVLGAAGNLTSFNRDSNTVVRVRRETSDGDIAELYKGATKVGSIGTLSNYPYFVGTSNGIRVVNSRIYPCTSTGSTADNVMDLGFTSARYDDIYATNGTIQTSDQNEKQQVAALTDAEITAAKAISALFKTFKWNDAVAEKGDAARTHAGVIAQDVQAAMTAAGLDAGDYAFFISSTWWETQTEVPAVEVVEAVDAVYEDVVIPAVEEELDEDGNVIVEAQPERTEQRLVSEAIEAIEAVDAYTRTDTYETAEEAPEGATERTRLGIRYPELLAFVGAATEQRLANIETRLAALEA